MAQEKAKYSTRHGLQQSGVFVDNASIWENNVFKLVVENAGVNNTIQVLGRITGEENFHLIDSIIGNGSKIIDIQFYDFIRLNCTVYDSPTGYIKVTGSAFTSTIGTSGGSGGDASAANQVIGNNYLQGINNKTQGSLLANIEFDDIQVSYPASTREVYNYYYSSSLVRSIEVTYTDATKRVLTRVRKV